MEGPSVTDGIMVSSARMRLISYSVRCTAVWSTEDSSAEICTAVHKANASWPTVKLFFTSPSLTGKQLLLCKSLKTCPEGGKNVSWTSFLERGLSISSNAVWSEALSAFEKEAHIKEAQQCQSCLFSPGKSVVLKWHLGMFVLVCLTFVLDYRSEVDSQKTSLFTPLSTIHLEGAHSDLISACINFAGRPKVPMYSYYISLSG